MKKRILSVLMVAAMTTAVFAGCGSSSTGSAAGSTAASTGSAAASGSAAAGDAEYSMIAGTTTPVSLS